MVAILTARNVPGNRNMGHLVKDWPAMIAEGEETRYIGDSIALVAAKEESLKGNLELNWGGLWRIKSFIHSNYGYGS